MTDFRAKGTIIGPTGLTAVFGMGTGVTPPVWSPEIHQGGGQAPLAKVQSERSRDRGMCRSRGKWLCSIRVAKDLSSQIPANRSKPRM